MCGTKKFTLKLSVNHMGVANNFTLLNVKIYKKFTLSSVMILKEYFTLSNVMILTQFLTLLSVSF